MVWPDLECIGPRISKPGKRLKGAGCRLFRLKLAPRAAPQFGQKQKSGDGCDDAESEEEEVDEGVHARQWNTGGRTSAGGGQIFLRLKVEFEARVEGFPPADAAKSLRFPHSFL